MVSNVATNSTAIFTALPTDEEDQDGLNSSRRNLNSNNSSSDEILDNLLTKVGYGLFQRKLMILCGFGWLADNMWLQTIAIILPRVQDHYDVPDKWIGVLSSSLFAGMTFGAFFWGAYSDSKGRKIPYTVTLVITTVFGLLSSFAFNFASLCFTLFFLGFGVGGNMPTDGALFLEFLPKEYHYLLTFMSVFFSFGAVIASILGYVILPKWSCPEDGSSCDVSAENNGWRILLFTVAFVTFVMLLLRSFWLRLPETPKFLMSQDKANETIIVLQDIAKINGSAVQIHHNELPKNRKPGSDDENDEGEDDTEASFMLAPIDRIATVIEQEEEQIRAFKLLLGPKWRVTTLLIWAIWTITSVAYTMFNGFLPKFLETLGFEGESVPTREQVYWDYMIYSFAGVPGSVIASWLIETRLGRKGTMAVSAFGSSVSLFLFSIISSRITMVLSSSSVSFLATLLYAVIYGYTPEVFDTQVRGTAVGTASGLGRIAGIVSPIITGILLTVNTSLPLYISVIGFAIVGLCVMLLPFETKS